MPVQIFVSDRAALRERGLATVLWGLALTAFGVAVLFLPELTGSVLIALIGATIFLVGLSLMYGAYRLREVAERMWVLALAPAVMVTLFGAFVWLFPGAVGTLILVFIAVMIILVGFGDIGASFMMAPVFSWWWLRLIRGLVMSGAGAWILLSGVSGLAAIGVLVGLWALLVGALTVTFGTLALRKA